MSSIVRFVFTALKLMDYDNNPLLLLPFIRQGVIKIY